jgi:hypothetical protein
VADQTVDDRYRIAFIKDSHCAVCNQQLDTPKGALFLEQNGRLVHPGNCSAEALKHLFAYASRGLRGRKSHRGAR